MKKVKAFINEHEDEIKTVAKVSVCLIVGGTIGYFIGYKNSPGNRYWIPDSMMDVLKDAMHVYPNRFNVFNGYTNQDGIKVMDLGELGKKIVECGGKDDIVYTHFIAIGPESKT